MSSVARETTEDHKIYGIVKGLLYFMNFLYRGERHTLVVFNVEFLMNEF